MVMLASQFPPAQKSKWPMRLTLSSLVIFQVILWTVLSPIIPVVTAIKLEPDGGYTGLVFKIHKDVPEDMCEDIIKQMKAMLNEASRVLYNAMDEKVYFSDAIVVVPPDWSNSKCKEQIQTPMSDLVFRDVDVHVGLDHPIYRKSPFTQQSRGCGQSGDHISMPYHFFTDWNTTMEVFGENPAKTFVHEWSKYRYGVFDEYGYPGDKLYPHYYKVQNEIVPTGSTDVKIQGSWKTLDSAQLDCDPSQSEKMNNNNGLCTFHVDLEQNEQATCSLGYLPFLTNVQKYCTLNEQWGVNQALPPTKHNVLCQARGAKEVISNHVELKNRQYTTDSFSLPDVAVRVVKQPKPKYVLVLESSSSMSKLELWKWVSKAVHKFIRNDLPSKSKVAVVTFSNDSSIEHNLGTLTDDETRARIADSIPDKYKVQRSPDLRCVRCGIQTAMEQVLQGDQAGAHIILVTRGTNDTLDLNDENLILEYVEKYQVKFSSILVPEYTSKASSFYDSLSQLSGGSSFVYKHPFSNKPIGAGIYHHMIEAFYGFRLLDYVDTSMDNLASSVPVTAHAQVVTREAASLKSSGTFSIDSTLGQSSMFGIIVDDPQNHNIKSITFTDNANNVYGPYSSLSSEYNVINVKTINFPKTSDTLPPPFDDPAHLGLKWKYEVKWYPDGDRSLENVIFVESKPRNLGTYGGMISVKMWTSSEDTTDTATADDPLRIFVQVSAGSSPVLQARVNVLAKVHLFNGSSSPAEVNLDPIELWDNGNGNPDLMAGDGIYSRYLTQYPGKGRYSFQAYADDNDGKAYTIQAGRNGRAMPSRPQDPSQHPLCCGSEVKIPTDLQRPSGSFKRTLIAGPTVHLIDVPNPKIDKMPPARISDFRLAPDENDGSKLVASWTAPGDDFDTGNVSKYEFIFSEDITDLLDSTRNPPILHKVTQSDVAGTDANHSFTFNKYDKDYHVAMYGIDNTGNKADISNIILVRLPEPTSTIGPIDPTTTPPTGETDWVMVGVVSGVTLTLLILLLVGVYIYLCKLRQSNKLGGRNHKSKSSGVNVDLPTTNGSAASDNSSFDDAKNSSSNQLVPQISTISSVYKSVSANNNGNGAGVGSTSSTSFANGITPTYWSASQLLKEHEERKMRETAAAANANAKMSSIAEENAGYDYHSDVPYHVGYTPAYATEYPGGGIQSQNDLYNNLHHHHQHNNQYMFNPYNAGQRLSTTDSYYQSGGVDYNPNMDPDPINDMYNHPRNNNSKSSVAGSNVGPPKNSGNSDNSSSGTLGLANNSLQGSLISVNSGVRPPSSAAKTRNITQV